MKRSHNVWTVALVVAFAFVQTAWAQTTQPEAAADAESPATQPATPTPPAPAPPAFVVVFDFAAPQLDDAGTKLSRSVFDKIRRLKLKAPGLSLVDPLTAADATIRYRIDWTTPPGRVAAVLAGELAANVAVLGTLARSGEDWTATVRVLDLRSDADAWRWERTFGATGERARGLLADQIAEAVTGLKVPKPREVGDDPEPAQLGPTVTANGDFEAGADGTPAAWGPIDNLTAFWVDDPASARGKILRINTDVYESQWKQWRSQLAAGAQRADAPKPVPTTGPKYDTVAGTYGIHVFGDEIAAKAGMRYRVLADARGRTTDFFFPKVFVKGYAPVASPDEAEPQFREVWRTYLALRNATGDWQHYSQTLTPAPNVQRLRVIIYAYWPPGVYEFDNVRLVEEPVAPSAAPETDTKGHEEAPRGRKDQEG